MGLAPVQAGQRITAAVANSLPVTLSPLTLGSVSSSAAETIIGSFTIPANNAVAGNGYAFHILGNANDTGTPTLTFNLRINSVSGSIIGLTMGPWTCRTSQGDMIWALDGSLYVIAGGAACHLQGHTIWDETVQGAPPGGGLPGTPTLHGNPTYDNQPATFDSTQPWSIVITAKWSISNAFNLCQTLAGSLFPI